MDELAEGIVAVAEAGGSLLLGLPPDEDGAEGLVLALLWGAGILEKAEKQCLVHVGGPGSVSEIGVRSWEKATTGWGHQPGAKIGPNVRKASANREMEATIAWGWWLNKKDAGA
jgi:hypothetical protein